METHPTLEKLAKERSRLIELVAGLSEEALEQRHGEGWTVRELLTHLLNAEEDHCKVIALSVRGQGHRLPSQLDLDAHNAERLAGRGHLPLAALLDGLAAQRDRTRALFEGLDEGQLATPLSHPALGDTTVGKIFRIIGIHDKMHTQEISAALEAGA